MSVVAIIPAAGMGVRMGGGTPKQFLSLEGVPIFVHTLRKFVASEVIEEIYLVLRADDLERTRQDVERERFAKPVRLFSGGATRQETVARALAEAPRTTVLVVVHDAVRPFVALELIRRVVDQARKDGAVILGIPSVDTVKQVEIATLEWVDWYNHRRLHSAAGDNPPAELEAAHYRQHRPHPEPADSSP